MALDAVFTWVSQPKVENEKVRSYAARSHLANWMTPEELKIWKTARPRAHEEHGGDIGWRLENMWPLAWILGFRLVPSFDGEMIEQGVGLEKTLCRRGEPKSCASTVGSAGSAIQYFRTPRSR